MASVQKITSSASRDIDFNKLVLKQSNVRASDSGRLGDCAFITRRCRPLGKSAPPGIG